MICRQSILVIVLFFLLTPVSLLAQQSTTLPRSTPEAEGVSSAAISRFLNAAAGGKTEFHSFMLLRHGKVIAEGWWNPYRPDLKHTLYSCSKSFTAAAIGFAVSEKLLSVNDKVVSFFPNDLPDTVSPYLAALTVKDVLMMSDGQDPDPTSAVASKDTNWIKGFLATRIINQPGTKFLYNSLGTYMLSAIVQKVTGQQTLDYLKPRLFQPLGISGMDWETDTKGINTGGWGLRLKTEDMARFAQLFLQKGVWNGRQILPASWIAEASTAKIMQDPSAPQSKKDSSDWLQGYCYQMWRCRHNAFRGDGAFGQFMIVMPDQDATLAITAETADMQEEINLVWKYLLPAFKKNKLPADKVAAAKLQQQIKNLALPAPAKRDDAMAAGTDGKTFDLSPNKLHLQKISFNFSDNICNVKFQTDTSAYKLSFGSGQWQNSKTTMAGPSLTAANIENTAMIYPAEIATDYSWKEDRSLELVIRYIESPHTETFTCHFEGKRFTMEVVRSLDFGKNTIVLQGVLD